MLCERVEAVLSAYLDDELGLAERSGVEEHLAQCQRCSDELAQLGALTALVSDAVPLPGTDTWEGFEHDLRDGLRHVQVSPRWQGLGVQRALVWTAAAAALVLVCLRFSLWLSEPRLVVHAGARLPLLALQHSDPPRPAAPSQASLPELGQVPGAERTLARLLPEAGPRGEAVAALRSDGLVQLAGHASRLSELYPLSAPDGTQLATADASLLLQGALSARVALELEATVLGPQVRQLLGLLVHELAELERATSSRAIRRSARQARELVGVAALLEGIDPLLSGESARRVREEVTLVRASAGVATSPTSASEIDYRRFRPRGIYSDEGDHARAVAWLSQRGFSLDRSRPDSLRAASLIGLAVAQGRTPSGQAGLAAQAGIEAGLEVLFGPPDGLTPLDMLHCLRRALPQATPRLGVLERDELMLAVADQALLLARAQRKHRVAGAEEGGAAGTFYVLGHLRSLEGQVLSRLTAPELPERYRPSSLDLLALLGSRRARTAVSALGLDRAPGYDDELRRLGSELRRELSPEALRTQRTALERNRLWALEPLLQSRNGSGLPFQTSRSYRDRLLLAGLGGLNTPTASVLQGETGRGPLPLIEPLPRLHARLGSATRALYAVSEQLLPSSPRRARLLRALQRVAVLEEALRDASLDVLLGREPSPDTTTRLRDYAPALHDLGPPRVASVEDLYEYEFGREILHRGVYRLDTLLSLVQDPWSGEPRLGVGAAVAACEVWTAGARLTPVEIPGHEGVQRPLWASHLHER